MQTWFKSLMERRVPQILGVYLGASWGVIGFVDWLVDRFLLSPNLPIFCFAVLVCMIPTVVLLAYFHGKPGRDQWSKYEKVGIPLNLILAALVLMVFFSGKELGAASQRVTVTDEEGNTIERTIPRSEFRKKLAIYFFTNESGQRELDWLQYGLTELIKEDVFQDIFIESYSGHSGGRHTFYHKMKKAGFASGLKLPLTLQQQIAKDYNLKYFVNGSFTKENDHFQVTIKLYETKRAKLLVTRSFQNTDIFALVDALTVQLKHDLEIPTHHIEEVKDLPVAEITSTSVEAFREYVIALNALMLDNDYKKAIEHLNTAVQHDSTFAMARLQLAQDYFYAGQTERCAKELTAAFQYLYKLTERLQFGAKSLNYYINQQMDKQFALFKMWTQLYPQDLNSHLNLAYLYQVRNLVDDAIAEYQKVLEIDPEQVWVLRKLGDIYLEKGEYEPALSWYQKFAEKFPDEAVSYLNIGQLYEQTGQFDLARENYEKANLLEANNTEATLHLGDIAMKQGDFEQARQQYEQAVKRASSPQQRANAYYSVYRFYVVKGELRKALDYFPKYLAELGKYLQPIEISFRKFDAVETYAESGQEARAYEELDALVTELGPPFDVAVRPVGELFIRLAKEDTQKVRPLLNAALQWSQQMRREDIKLQIYDIPLAKYYELCGDYHKAIQSCEKIVQQQPSFSILYTDIAKCYRKLHDLKHAQKAIEMAIRFYPAYPKVLLEAARINKALGHEQQALEQLQRAVNVWRNADAEYKPATEARQALERWRA